MVNEVVSRENPVQSKSKITTISIIASGGLAALKFVVGLLTGSLGLIAEGVHSLLDLLSTLVTFVAVRVAAKPPDANHPYGHERAESLGALAGMTLLGATAIIIGYHAIVKIIWEPGAPKVTIWSFSIIVISIVVDFMRVQTLKRAAKHYQSQALASDAEHFSNDMLGSAAVLLGLLFIYLAKYLPLPVWLVERADAFAALGVVAIAFKSVWHIGAEAIKSLMDDVPEDLLPRLQEAVEKIPGVVPGAVTVKTRFVGNKAYVEATVGTLRSLTFEKAHELTETIEQAIREELDGAAEIIVHAEPIHTTDEPYSITVRSVAARLDLRIHNLNLYLVANEMRIELDLEVPDNLTLREAHTKSELLETALQQEFALPVKVAVHIEPRNETPRSSIRHIPSMEKVRQALADLTEYQHVDIDEVLLTDEGLVVTLIMTLPGDTSLASTHTIMYDLERALKLKVPDIIRVHIDPEPEK
ncbi:cation diffusion facilitator family transporter [Chitinophaga polysaccharea]|uniref:Cation diffusion facilitator family transporter n=1 Tax=Chitinophaga polysaccharea TaxID=1293035 RepID=A0A561PC87_9BACT|nr:cation diffusion facilitator family transporter [Chitinophaga polysaccharea]TWF35729.1 cation diffusion facilitator family transporter [Chitinophaga polysaccharea]